MIKTFSFVSIYAASQSKRAFSQQQCAEILNVSLKTIKRRCQMFSVFFGHGSRRYAVSDRDLDIIVSKWNDKHPYNGYRFIKNAINIPEGIDISYERVRKSFEKNRSFWCAAQKSDQDQEALVQCQGSYAFVAHGHESQAHRLEICNFWNSGWLFA